MNTGDGTGGDTAAEVAAGELPSASRPTPSRTSGLRAALAGLRYGAQTALSPRAVHGAAVEVGWWTAHLAIYPLGLLRDGNHRAERLNLARLAPAQRGLLVGDVAAAATPIVLIHGIVDNHTIFALMRRNLLRRGFGRVRAFSYSPLTLDVRRTAARLAWAA
jgi:triacylglycerol lipase